MTLFEMTQNTAALYDLLQQEEIDEQTFNDMLESFGTEEKIEGYCQIIKQLTADEEMFKAELDRLKSRKDSLSKSIDRMKKALQSNLEVRNETKIKAGTFTVSIRESQAVSILDIDKLPQEVKTPQPPKVDKNLIKAMLKDGIKFEGAELVTNRSVSIR